MSLIWIRRIAISVVMAGFLLCIAYWRLIGFGFGHDPLVTSSSLWRLMTRSQAYDKMPNHPARYLVKRSARQVFLSDLKITEQKDSQMGAMHFFKHPRGLSCAIVQPLNDWYTIYEFMPDREC